MDNGFMDRAADRLEAALAAARKRGAAAGRFVLRRGRSIGCEFENARLKTAETEQSLSLGVEVAVGGRQGRTACSSLEDLDEMLARAFDLAAAGSAVHFADYPSPAPFAAVKTHSQRTADLPRASLIDACQRMAEALKAHDPDLFIECGGGRSETDGLLVTSGGVVHRRRGTGWHLHAWVQRTVGTDMLFSGFGRSWGDVNEFFDPDLILARILQDLRWAKDIAPAPAGRTTVLVCPDVLGMFLYPLAIGVNGRNVAKGDSPLAGRLGEQVLDSCLTITDDPHLDYCPGARDVSGDGIPTAPTTIFDRGVLKTFLYDLDSAGLAGAKPTGHDGCSAHSPVVAPGRRSSEDLLASIPDGIYVRNLMGFGQSNIVNGDFASNVALGFRIRDGQVVGRVKDTMLAGNVYDLLKGGVELSRDIDPVLRMPYAVLQGATASTARGG